MHLDDRQTEPEIAGCIWTTGKWNRRLPEAFGRLANGTGNSRVHLDDRQMEPETAECIWSTSKQIRTQPKTGEAMISYTSAPVRSGNPQDRDTSSDPSLLGA